MIYVLVSIPEHFLCLQVENSSKKEAHMWHCRFGHLNHKALSTLSNKKMVIGLHSLTSPKKICTIVR